MITRIDSKEVRFTKFWNCQLMKYCENFGVTPKVYAGIRQDMARQSVTVYDDLIEASANSVRN